jgi:polar amino acid transport system substrate-binding protein
MEEIKMKRKLTAIFLSSVFLVTGILLTGCGGSNNTSTANSDSSKRNITIATSANPRPYEYQDENGNLTGYDIELVNALFTYLPQYNVQFETSDLDSCLTGLSSGRYQIVANNLGYKDQRAELYLYQGPLNKSTSVIALKKGLSIKSLLDLAGHATEAEPQVADTGYLEAFYDKHSQLNKSDIHYTEKQPAQQYQDLNDGSVDFLLSSLESFKAYTQEFGYKDLTYYVLTDAERAELKAGLKLPNVYFCLGPDETQLASDLTEAMKQYKQSGKWSELAIKWYGEDVSPDLNDINYWDNVKR